MLFICVISASGLLDLLLTVGEGWPFKTSFGGLIGEYINSIMVSIFENKIYVVMTYITMFVVSFVIGAGVTLREIRFLTKAIRYIAYYIVVLINLLLKIINFTLSIFGVDNKIESIEVISAPTSKPRRKRQSGKAKVKKRKAKPKKSPNENGEVAYSSMTLPPSDLLTGYKDKRRKTLNDNVLQSNARKLEEVLTDFGVKGEIVNVRPGPVVILYELEPAAGTKTSRVIGLADDIARSMSAVSARIAVVAGKNAIGIELPNEQRETVYLREQIESDEYSQGRINLPMILGKDISGETIVVDLVKMPHLLVAGTTGSGKSVAINSMIISILYSMTPEQCRFIMIDPKMLELSVYDGIPHLLSPVVTDPSKAVVALKWTVKEMEERYRSMAALGVRNIDGHNKRVEEAIETGEILERRVQTGFDPETGKPIHEMVPLKMEKLPYIVVIVDEMADLMLVAGKDVEGSIQRLAQMARAAGIHIIMATQRPSVDVITGVIKANFPTRISFQVTSRIDSRTILGEMGAEQLLGMGDMLYMSGGGRTQRVHGPFVSDKEVERIVSFLKEQSAPEYIDNLTEDTGEYGGDTGAGSTGNVPDSGGENELYDRAVAIVVRDKKASISYVQRQLRIGYNRAANLVERMEEEGVVSAPNHSGRREVIVGQDD
jgi:S-DNA-T family DNA segregation ATPase FtsK/SpoIIIE